MKMMMIEAPETCEACLFESEEYCFRYGKALKTNRTRPQWCIDKDVEVEDEKI